MQHLFLVLFTLVLTIASTFIFVTQTHIKNNRSLVSASECSNLAKDIQLKCWESAIEDTLKKQGLDASFALLDQFYKTEPQFASNCHSFTHMLGQSAYYLFSKQHSINLTPKASYCGYGFYHGFMETLLNTTGNLEEAHSFCEMVDSQLTTLSARSIGACYHGIGHGVTDGSELRTWGSIDAIISPGLTLCQKISSNEKDLYRCGTGVFNSLAIMLGANQYGLKLNRKDPYKLCSKFPQKSFKEACYHQMNTITLWLGNHQLKQAARYVETIKDDHYAVIAMRGLAAEAASTYIAKSDFSENILDCQSSQPRLQIICIDSFAEGLVEHGNPSQRHIKAFELCQSSLLTTSQRDSCFQSILDYLKKVSTHEGYQIICQNIPKSQKNNCTD